MHTFLLKNIRTERKRWTEDISAVDGVTASTNLLIRNGKVEAYIDDISTFNEDIKIVDGNGLLIVPALREMHCHIDKSKLGTSWTPVSKASSIVERFTNEPKELDKLEIPMVERAANLIALELSHGVDFFRTHIDVHSAVGQRFLEQSLIAAERFQETADFEFVAFPQHGLLRSHSIGEVDTALKNGATIIGGVDPASVDGDSKASLNATFELAVKHDVDIDLHIHDRYDDFLETLKHLLNFTEDSGYQNRVAISHGFGLNDLDHEESELFNRIKTNGIKVISSVPITGNIPPLERLRAHGIDVNIGCDNIYDCWSPYGSGDIREKLRRYGEAFNIRTHNEIADILPVVTGKPLDYENEFNASGINVGDEASFLLTEASCITEFIARPVTINKRFYKGKCINFPGN